MEVLFCWYKELFKWQVWSSTSAYTLLHILWCDMPSSVKSPKSSKTLQNYHTSFLNGTLDS